MPLKVKYYILIRYEDLINDFENTINRIKNMGLKIRNNIEFPTKEEMTPRKLNQIEKNLIYNHPDFDTSYEKKIGYI